MKTQVMIRNISLAIAIGMTLVFLGVVFSPARPSHAFMQAKADQRRELAESWQCLKDFGPGSVVTRDSEGRTVCVREAR